MALSILMAIKPTDENIWPKSKGGKLQFAVREYKDFKGYIVTKSNGGDE
jgi:hypothetical protein